MKKAAWLASVGVLLAAIATLVVRAAGPATTAPATLDRAQWVAYHDSRVGWSLRHPPEWRVQPDEGGCAELGDPHPQVLVSNLSVDLEHPELGSGSCSDLWDMRELPPSFVLVEVETPGGPPPGPEQSVRRLPLSLDDLDPGRGYPRLGVPQELWVPVWIDPHHQYFVRVWLGDESTAADRRAASLIVSSIRFKADRT